MIVTTSGRYNDQALNNARSIAERYNIQFVMRKKLSIKVFKERYNDDVLVVGNDDISIFPKGSDNPIKYHPNFALVRAKRMKNDEEDALIAAAELKQGMSFLDCTMGLGADSVIASLAVGQDGTVTALENSMILYLLVKEGFRSYDTNLVAVNDAMKNITVHFKNHIDYLKALPDNSYDVVYFDPMFDTEIDNSQSLRLLEDVTYNDTLQNIAIEEAKRVAAKKVILKDHFRSTRFKKFGFTQQIRKTSKVHYGIIKTSSEFDS